MPGRCALTDDEFHEILKRLLRDSTPEQKSVSAAISIVAARLHSGKLKITFATNQDISEAVRRVVELGADDAGNESFW